VKTVSEKVLGHSLA